MPFYLRAKLGMIIELCKASDSGIYYDNDLNHAQDMRGSSLIYHNSTIQLTDAYRIFILKKMLVGCDPLSFPECLPLRASREAILSRKLLPGVRDSCVEGLSKPG